MYNIAKKFFDFRRNFLGIISLIFIFFVFIVSIFSYVISPDNSVNGNTMNLSIHSKKPGFSTKMLILKEKKTNRFSLESIFFGHKDQINQIPIKKYKIELIIPAGQHKIFCLIANKR